MLNRRRATTEESEEVAKNVTVKKKKTWSTEETYDMVMLVVMIMLIVMVTQIIASLKSAINNNLVIKEERRTHSGSCLSLQLDDSVNNRQVVENSNDNSNKRKCLLYTEPTPYIDLLMKAVVGFPNQGSLRGTRTRKYNAIERKFGNDWPPFGYTMIGNTRLENFRAAIEDVNRNNIPGDIIEMGVWRGGAMIMAMAVINEYKGRFGGTIDRELYVLDAFEEIPKSSYGSNSDFLFNTEQDVKDNFKVFDAYNDNVGGVNGNGNSSKKNVVVHFRRVCSRPPCPLLRSIQTSKRLQCCEWTATFMIRTRTLSIMHTGRFQKGELLFLTMSCLTHPSCNVGLISRRIRGLPKI